MTKSRDDIQGLEYDWLATDSIGQVGLFSTAGGGGVPEAFLRDSDAHDRAIDELLAMPKRTAPVFAPELAPGWPNVWQLLAERGLYGFDSDFFGSDYRLVSVPEQPSLLSSFPESVRSVCELVRLSELRFDRIFGVTKAQAENAGRSPLRPER